jgi:hypothetical protein
VFHRRYNITHKEVIIVDVNELKPKYFPKFKVGDLMMMKEEEEEEEVESVATKTI